MYRGPFLTHTQIWLVDGTIDELTGPRTWLNDEDELRGRILLPAAERVARAISGDAQARALALAAIADVWLCPNELADSAW